MGIPAAVPSTGRSGGWSGAPGCVVQYSVGSEPSGYCSVVTLGHAWVASMPVSAHTTRETVPAGTGKSSTGRPRVAAIMKSVHAGRAARAPVMPAPIGRFWSKPTQTPLTRLGT